MPKKQAKRGCQIVVFHFIKGHPTELHGVACSLGNACFYVYKVVDNYVMIFHFALFSSKLTLLTTSISCGFSTVKPSFLFCFADDCLLGAFGKFN